jgi:rhodanese-related sulfurtransferase
MTFRNILIASLSIVYIACSGQVPQQRAHCTDPKFDAKVASYINFSVPTVSPDDVKKMDKPLLLDARERAEFEVSHLPNAVFVGYNHFDKTILSQTSKNQPIVVYCSIGYRSEKIGEKLQKMGFTNVTNLYGSIFEWVNQGNPLVDNNNQPTTKVHTYNKNWSRWVEKGKAEKVW